MNRYFITPSETTVSPLLGFETRVFSDYKQAVKWAKSCSKEDIIVSSIDIRVLELKDIKATYLPLFNTENIVKEHIQKILQLGQEDIDEV